MLYCIKKSNLFNKLCRIAINQLECFALVICADLKKQSKRSFLRTTAR